MHNMAKRKAAPLNASLLARKGEAVPASNQARSAETTVPPLPRGTKDTVAVTVRLDHDRYHKLVGYGAQFTPRRTNQEIFITALDAFLAQEE
jgi:hypothetical protein